MLLKCITFNFGSLSSSIATTHSPEALSPFQRSKPCSWQNSTFQNAILMPFQENFIEGGYETDHHMVEYLTETVLSLIHSDGSFVNYHSLMEVMMYQPHFLCHLMKSKLPPPPSTSPSQEARQVIRDFLKDHSGRCFSLSLFIFVISLTMLVGVVRYMNDSIIEILGWSHTLSRSTSDLLKVLFVIFAITLCNFTPFLYRFISKPYF